MKKFIYTLVVLLFTVSLNAQWEPDVRLTNASGTSYTVSNWCIAANKNLVHVVWQDSRDGNYEIYYKRSTDSGVTWGSDTCLSNNTADSYSPTIACSGSNVHIVWEDTRNGNGEIYYKRSSDDGANWGTDTRLTNAIYVSEYPSIAVSDSLVLVVWDDYRDGNYKIFYKRSTDGGINWGVDSRLSNTSENAWYPAITISGSNVHVVWDDIRDGNDEIYYRRSTNGGYTWTIDTRLTYNSSWSQFPSVAANGSLVHVVWYDYRDVNDEIYYKRSTNGGITWGLETRLTNNIDYSEYPSIAVSGSLLHLVWIDTRDGNPEIYYKHSTDSGINWGADTRLTNYFAESSFPSIALSGSIVHVVWKEGRNGNFEIYYKRNPTGNPTGIQNISTEIPSAFSLSQNYPNPFNPTTAIRFQVTGNSIVTIKVYDIMGREVETLVNETLQAGTYSVDWNASDFPSGVYFYRLQTGSFTNTKRMTLIK